MTADLADKYPGSTGRRRFVKGVVGSGALGGLAAAGAAASNATTTPSGVGGGARVYVGVENVAGPAPRAMPQIPVRIDDEGYLRGLWGEVREREDGGRVYEVAESDLPGPDGGTITYSSEWFQYCGVQTYPGIRPDADQDEYFRHADADYYDWQRDAVEPGERVHVDEFADYREWANDVGRGGLGKPALVTWRSEDVPPSSTLPVQLIRSPLVEAAPANPWLVASTRRGFIAFLDKCTHFCCVPGFKAFGDSEREAGEGDMVYCQCHQSVYNPFSLVQRTFIAFPRPE